MSTKTEDESFDSGSSSTDYKSPTERINNALQKIRSELSEIRDQDLKLLKQLIQISETIKRLSEDRLSKRRTWYGQRQSICSESAELYLDIEPLTPDLDDYREAILVRQFSEPVSFSRDDLLDMRTNLSIFDPPISLDSNDTMDQSWPPNFSRVQLRHRPHSVSILTSSRSYGMESSQEWMEGSDKSYEEILQRNVRLWKGRQSIHTSDDEEEGARTPVNDWSFFTANGRRSPVSLAEVNKTNDKRNSDSGSSSSSSVINSSTSSYGSSAVNGGSSRSSSSSCSSCVFSGVSAGVGETMVLDNSSNVVSAVAENRNLARVFKPTKDSIILGDSTEHYGGDKKHEEDEKKVGGDGNQTPVIETGEPVNEWMKGDSIETERAGEFETRVPDGKERGAPRDREWVGEAIASDVREGAAQLMGGTEGTASTSGAGKEIGSREGMMEERELVRGGEREGERGELICMAGAGKQKIQEEENAVGGRAEGGGSIEGEKERGRDKGREGGGDKPKGKESGSSSGGGVVRALLDHIGRKIENRVTVGMAEYSRSFLPVISEISKRDGRQKTSAHRPRELDIT